MFYQGGGTSFTTTDPVCGVGYVYRVAAYGQQGPSVTTPWDTSGTLAEYPCSVSASGATSMLLIASWPQVTTATVPDIVWCAENTLARGQLRAGGLHPGSRGRQRRPSRA